MSNFITRQQFMEKVSTRAWHIKYYRQYVTSDVIRWVLSNVGFTRIRKSNDFHFNDIPLHLWEMPATQEIRKKMEKLGEINSIGAMVCITKAAAYELKTYRSVNDFGNVVILDLRGGLVVDRVDEGQETANIRVLIRDYDIDGIDLDHPDYEDLKMDSDGNNYIEKWF